MVVASAAAAAAARNEELSAVCNSAVANAPEPVRKRRGLPFQDEVERFYNSIHIQVFVAFLIGANFLTNMVEKQIDPKGTNYSDAFGVFELGYNILFTIELVVNLYAHWFCSFWRSGWNIFDTIVVTIGVVNTLQLPLPSAFKMLRMMRAFRVFRLFKRVASLNKIIVALVRAVPGVVNAFLILAIVMCIYAILAVEFFQDVGEGCKGYFSSNPGYPDSGTTARGNCFGGEYFGSFSKSWYSFFQVLTGESWSEAVARPAIWVYDDSPIHALGSALFFVSYCIVTGLVLINVVLSALFDKMAESDPGDEDASPSADPVDAEAAVEASMSPQEQLARQRLQTVHNELEQFAAEQSTMQTEIDRTRADMAALTEQLRILIKAVQQTGTC